MNPEQLAQIAARARQAAALGATLDEADVPGPWDVLGDVPMVWDARGDAIVDTLPDGRPYLEPPLAVFIAASRIGWPALAADIDTLLADNARLTAELAQARCGPAVPLWGMGSLAGESEPA